VALVTPFKNNEVNYEKLAELIDWHINMQTDAVIVCGTTGESATLSKEERKATIDFACRYANHRLPIIAGTGTNNTKDVIELSLAAEKAGADALLMVTPYYNKTTQRGLVEHFTTIANEVHTPIIIYNVPSRTGLNLLPQTMFELSKHPNICGIKEASGDISQVAEIARLCGEGIDLYSGNDDQTVPLLSLGGIGVISVVANILPKDAHDLVMAYLNGKVEEARKKQLAMNKLNHSLFLETNPIPIKTAMNLLGMDVGPVRLPLVSMEPKNMEILMKDMIDYGLELVENK
jgi:4-hydroxy-tetrahydrodipicolinate synthase